MASVVCRQSIPFGQGVPAVNPGEFLSLEEDLAQLCAAGLLEAFRDEHDIVRYRPIERA